MSLILFVQVLSLVLLLLASISAIPKNPYVHLGWAGLFCWVLSHVLK